MRTWVGTLVAALVLVAPGLAMAHDTFIVPVAPFGAQPLRLQVTSSGFFPEPESAIRLARVERIIARMGGADLTTQLSAGDVSMSVQVGCP